MLATLLSYVLLYKYTAIFVMTFLGGIALPIPSGSAVMAAAAFALQGYFNFWGVLLAGFFGYVAGDSAGYWLVRLYGLPVLNKLHLGNFFKPEKLEAARNKIEKHPILTIYWSRFFTAIAPAVNVVCGITHLPYGKFLTFEVLGEVTEIGYYGLIGYFFGNNWEYFSQLLNKFWILAVFGAALSFVLWRLFLKKR